MKYLLVVLLFFSGVSYGQTTYYLRADTVTIQKVGSNSNLTIENNTRNKTNSFLQNYNNGRTRFAYAVDSVWKINDSMLVVRRGDGNDTLIVGGGGGATDVAADFKLIGSKIYWRHAINVVDMGADSTGATKSTAAFRNALALLVGYGGGKLIVPKGIYDVDSISIPAHPGPEEITIEIEGERMPTFLYGTVTYAYTFPTGGSIIKSSSTTAGSVIKALPLSGSFSFVNVILKNLDVRTYNDPSISGIDLRYAPFVNVENVFINTGRYSVVCDSPTHATAGIRMPISNNGAMSVLRNVVISGYATGIEANEHVDGDALFIYACLSGIKFVYPFGPHSCLFHRVEMGGVKYGFNVESDVVFKVIQYDAEHLDSANQAGLGKTWQITWADIYDPADVSFADIDYHDVHAMNIDNDFIQVGAKKGEKKWVGHSRNQLIVGTDFPVTYNPRMIIQSFNSTGGSAAWPGLYIRNTNPTAATGADYNFAGVSLTNNGSVGAELITNYGSGPIYPYNQGSGSIWYTYTNHPILIGVNNTTRLTLNTSGAIGFTGSFGSSGQVLQSNGSGGPPTWVAAGEVPLTFNNGLTRTSNTIKLGGALTGSTTIDGATRTYDFTVNHMNNILFSAGSTATENTIEMNNSGSIIINAAEQNMRLQANNMIYIEQETDFSGVAVYGNGDKYNNQTGTTYTLASTDNGKTVTLSNASPITLTVPASLPAGFHCTLVQIGAGQVTITPSSTTIHNRQSFTKIKGQWSMVDIKQYSTNLFVTQGDME